VGVTNRPGNVAVAGCAAPKWLRRIFVANLIAQTGIVVTGAVVRLTGSGLGCPTWPQCAPGSFVPTAQQAQAYHKYIEFGNRTLTFILGILAIAAIVGAIAWNRRLGRSGKPTRRPVVRLAAVPLIGTLAQAVLGGVTVLTGLNPLSVSAHFLLSAVLIALCVLLVVRAKEPGDTPLVRVVHPAISRLGQVQVVTAIAVLTLGTLVTGSGPHSGDIDADSRLPFDARSISWLHADLVLLFIGLSIGMIVALSVSGAQRKTVGLSWGVLVVALAQGLIGYVQYFTGLPWVLVMFHVLGATLLWIAVISSYLSLRTRGTESVDLTEPGFAEVPVSIDMRETY